VKIGNPFDLTRTGAPAAGAGSPDAAKAKAKATAGLTEPARDGGSAKVKLSGGLAALKGTADVNGAFDAKRVEQLKAAIADSSFKVNAETVANKVIASNLEALNRSAH
jgi:negative regulator of flagellin synthesis FlgM